jgi:hypothetical protein
MNKEQRSGLLFIVHHSAFIISPSLFVANFRQMAQPFGTSFGRPRAATAIFGAACSRHGRCH